jgi:hypothetical protein
MTIFGLGSFLGNRIKQEHHNYEILAEKESLANKIKCPKTTVAQKDWASLFFFFFFFFLPNVCQIYCFTIYYVIVVWYFNTSKASTPVLPNYNTSILQLANLQLQME